MFTTAKSARISDADSQAPRPGQVCVRHARPGLSGVTTRRILGPGGVEAPPHPPTCRRDRLLSFPCRPCPKTDPQNTERRVTFVSWVVANDLTRRVEYEFGFSWEYDTHFNNILRTKTGLEFLTAEKDCLK
ncbi:hypothetical protein JTE90_012527 [Oedothorax gibbosus]|uniref:Uncharacterized protein n=1 Tax=Oedothorax gibbosus TaxID=931172 RepID=A0AAV6UZ05_9ARAC|nr:hypothetical protein JTE90_012527 [Oedothorax gibbosus]